MNMNRHAHKLQLGWLVDPYVHKVVIPVTDSKISKTNDAIEVIHLIYVYCTVYHCYSVHLFVEHLFTDIVSLSCLSC